MGIFCNCSANQDLKDELEAGYQRVASLISINESLNSRLNNKNPDSCWSGLYIDCRCSHCHIFSKENESLKSRIKELEELKSRFEALEIERNMVGQWFEDSIKREEILKRHNSEFRERIRELENAWVGVKGVQSGVVMHGICEEHGAYSHSYNDGECYKSICLICKIKELELGNKILWDDVKEYERVASEHISELDYMEQEIDRLEGKLSERKALREANEVIQKELESVKEKNEIIHKRMMDYVRTDKNQNDEIGLLKKENEDLKSKLDPKPECNHRFDAVNTTGTFCSKCWIKKKTEGPDKPKCNHSFWRSMKIIEDYMPMVSFSEVPECCKCGFKQQGDKND